MKNSTASPLAWSRKYVMPIMVMMKADEEEEMPEGLFYNQQ